MTDYYEIDKLVALHVMKWKPVYYDDDVIVAWDIGKGRELFFTSPFESDNEWSPSTNISDAWFIVDNLSKNLVFRLENGSKDRWSANFFNPLCGSPVDDGSCEWFEYQASTPELAICLAGLIVVGVDVNG